MYPVNLPNSIRTYAFPPAGEPASRIFEVISLRPFAAFVCDLAGDVGLMVWKEAQRPANIRVGDLFFAKDTGPLELQGQDLLAQGVEEARRSRALSRLTHGTIYGGAIIEWKDTDILLELDGFHGFPVYLPVGEISGYLLTGAMRPSPGVRVNVKVNTIDESTGRVCCTMDNCSQPSVETVIRTIGGSLRAWEASGLNSELLALAERFVPQELVIELFRTVESGHASSATLNNSLLDAVLLYANRYQKPAAALEFKAGLAPLIVNARLAGLLGDTTGVSLSRGVADKGIDVELLAAFVLSSGISPILLRDIRRVKDSTLPAEQFHASLRSGAQRTTFMNAARPASHTRLLLIFGDGASSWQR